MKDLVRGRSVLVIGHSDADGHLASEQSRRNALRHGAKRCDVFIDPHWTRGYRLWCKYLDKMPIHRAQTIIFVDLMLDPADVSGSANAVVALANANKDKEFLLIDHHPMSGLPSIPENLRICFTQIVYACCYGEPGNLMVMASLCENEELPVAPLIDEKMRTRALGVRRAAADRAMAGENLMKLLADDLWDVIEQLALEPKDIHKSVRGWRHSRQPESPALSQAHAVALA